MTFEEKMKIVINNYFKKECSVNTSIREAFEKGFRIGVKKGQSAQSERIKGHWIEHDDCLTACECSVCHEKYNLYEEDVFGRNFCPNCGADMRGVTI